MTDKEESLRCVIADLCEQVRDRDRELARLRGIIYRANTAEWREESRRIAEDKTIRFTAGAHADGY